MPSRSKETAPSAEIIPSAPRHVEIVPETNDVWIEEEVPATCATIATLLEKSQQLSIPFLTIDLPRSEDLSQFPSVSTLVSSLASQLKEGGGQFMWIGDNDALPKDLREAITVGERSTRNNRSQSLIFATQGGWKYEIACATQMVARIFQNSRWTRMPYTIAAIDESLLSDYFPHPNIPSVDLVLHMGVTENQHGFSIPNGLNWHGAYTEHFVTNNPFISLSHSNTFEKTIKEDFPQRLRTFGAR